MKSTIILPYLVGRAYILSVLLFSSACNYSVENSRSDDSPTKQAKPNIVIIIADDLGYGGIGSYGNDSIATPHLDSLAYDGLKFTDFYANAPVCTPTRAALLTGRYQQRAGLEGVIYARGDTRQTGLDTTEISLAKVLQNNGYTTGIVGKWHLGYRKAYNPVKHGFEAFYGYVSGNVDYHTHYDNTGVYDWWHNQDTIQEEGYVTDLITEHAVEFIEQNREKPFFLYVAHEAPHVPFQGRNDPGYRFSGQEFTYYGPVKEQWRAYREMIEVMDEGIGKIMQTLKDHNLDENTLVFFLSDNGALEKYGSNGRLRGQKGSLYEGGIRVPAIAYWKGKIKPGTSSTTAMSMDLMPTALAVSKANLPPGHKLDGIDLSPLLFEEQPLSDRYLYWRYRKQKAVRQGAWKLLITGTDTALYNLEQDLKEVKNLAAQLKDTVKILSTRLQLWEEGISSSGLMKTN